MASAERWWVFDRPLARDPLFVIAIVLGAVGMVGIGAARDEYAAGAFVIALVTSIPAALLAVGITAGSVREYLRGRRE